MAGTRSPRISLQEGFSPGCHVARRRFEGRVFEEMDEQHQPHELIFEAGSRLRAHEDVAGADGGGGQEDPGAEVAQLHRRPPGPTALGLESLLCLRRGARPCARDVDASRHLPLHPPRVG